MTQVWTDCFGRRIDPATFKPAPIVAQERIANDNGRYLGQLVLTEGVGWTHTLHCYGTPAFGRKSDAYADFFRVKAALPPNVHDQIFGSEDLA